MTFFSRLSGGNQELIKLAILVLLSSFLSILVCVLTSVAISEDSKARGIKNRITFAIVGFFFPIPTAIVYLIVRKNAKKFSLKYVTVAEFLLIIHLLFVRNAVQHNSRII